MLSDDVRVMLRPFAVYRELGARDEETPGRAAVAKAGFTLLVVGSFVSLTSAGRFVAFHVASAFVFWAFLPLVQALAVTLAVRTVAPSASVRRALSLYFTGQAPWFFFLLAIAVVPFLVPNVYATMMGMVRYGIIPALMLTALVWGVVLTYACFRAGLDLARKRAVAATVLYYLVFAGIIVGYYLAMNQIQPQVPGIP